MSQQQSKYANMNNDYMTAKSVSQGGGNNGGINLYVGSANNPNNKMLSSLRDGSSEVFPPGAVMNNDYDPAIMQTFYSPNRMSNSQVHRRSNTGGSFTGSDYGTEKVRHFQDVPLLLLLVPLLLPLLRHHYISSTATIVLVVKA